MGQWLLEDLANKHRNNNNADAMWMLGVCCEFGIGTEQDVHRAEQLFESAAQQGNTTAMLLTDKLKNKNGRGCMEISGFPKTTKLSLKRHFFPNVLLACMTMREAGDGGVDPHGLQLQAHRFRVLCDDCVL